MKWENHSFIICNQNCCLFINRWFLLFLFWEGIIQRTTAWVLFYICITDADWSFCLVVLGPSGPGRGGYDPSLARPRLSSDTSWERAERRSDSGNWRSGDDDDGWRISGQRSSDRSDKWRGGEWWMDSRK